MNRLVQLVVILGGVATAVIMHWHYQQHVTSLNSIYEQQAKAEISNAKTALNHKFDSIDSSLGEITQLLGNHHLGKAFQGSLDEYSLVAARKEIGATVRKLAGDVGLIDLLLTHHLNQELHFSLVRNAKAEPDVLHIQRHYEWISENLFLSRMAKERHVAIVSSVSDGAKRQIYYSIPQLSEAKETAIMMVTLILDVQAIIDQFSNGQYLVLDGSKFQVIDGIGKRKPTSQGEGFDYKESVSDIGMRRLWGHWDVGVKSSDVSYYMQALNELKRSNTIEYSMLILLVLVTLSVIEIGIRSRHSLVNENRKLNKIIDEKVEEIKTTKENSRMMSRDLLDSEVRLHSIIDASTDGIVVCDRGGEIKSVNHALRNMLGYNDDLDFLGKSIEFIFPSFNYDEYEGTTLFDNAKANSEMRWIEASALSKDNQYIAVELIANRVKVGHHEALSMVVHDISEKIKDRGEIRDAQENLRAVIDNVAEGIITSDEKGIIRTFNPAAEGIFGWKSDEVIGENVTALMTGHDKERHDNYLRKYHDVGKSKVLGVGPREVIGVRRNGDVFHMEIATSEMRINNERMFIAIVRDISERKIVEKNMHMSYSELELLVDSHTEDLKAMNKDLVKARDDALVAARSKSGFLAMMSHEIRTPINGVLGMLSLVRETDLDNTQRDYIETAYSSGETLLELLNDVLDLSKIDAGRMYLENNEFDLYQIVEKAVYVSSKSLHERDVEITCCISHDVPRVIRGDAARLRQVISNLINNAVKFTQQGEISVVMKREVNDQDGRVALKFEVTDTGIGIENVDVERIFEEFSQVDSSDRRNYGGTGLGLTICRRIVSLMGGDIAVKSKVGEGSTFEFTAYFEPAKDTNGVALLDKGNVVIISDSETRRAAMCRQLRCWGVSADSVNVSEGYDFSSSSASGDAVCIIDTVDRYSDDIKFWEIVEEISGAAAGTVIICESANGSTLMSRLGNNQANMVNYPVLPSELYEKLGECYRSGSKKIEQTTIASNAESISSVFDDVSILIAEDNLVNQKVISAMLKRIGVNVKIVENGRKVLDALSVGDHDFSMVLMDCQMPEMDGYTATRRLRQYEKESDCGDRVPVIAMTAHALPGDREKCIDSGMDDYITKPIKIEAIKELIERWR